MKKVDSEVADNDDMLDLFGMSSTGDREQDERRLSRQVYKATECGAWLMFTDAGILLGSIVEGSDVDCNNVHLNYPFTAEAYREAIKSIEEEADLLWNEANRSDGSL